MTWENGTVSIACWSKAEGKQYREKVEAYIHRGLAVHEAYGVKMLNGAAVVAISHVATGLGISKTYFHDRNSAMAAAVAIGALPVLWTQMEPAETPSQKPMLRDAVEAICALCGSFEADFPIDGPGGHA
ncbi:hypothetical protein P9279_21985 [Mesorhizobium sp. WSM4962]|uniref:hypothetical protein n=1 Tax=Mesorhizobium sp. WSM4962 TaxID=3038548 RepID=UPI002416C3DE|nr:hypothetical protein [Mesorhizobium sp. WSM4962]MDG4903183.1 hypothetical protein [Mesorhizobium sp. WSM4962]